MTFRPLIVICGTTGVGKSRLAVELALRLREYELPHGWDEAKIINADAMQVYKGLDTLTNKLPLPERKGVEHLLIDFKSPGEQYVVGQWVQDATQTIEEMHDQKQLPIVVGGTSYWLQHLIFPDRLAGLSNAEYGDSSEDCAATSSLSSLSPELQQLFDSLPIESSWPTADETMAYKLYQLLCALDPKIAETWHWRDTRKVLRSLTIIRQTGRRPSDIYAKQSQNLPFPRYDTLCFWLYSRMETLDARLQTRVEEMLRSNALAEVAELLGNLRSHDASEIDYSNGLYQSIGFKELSRVLNSTHRTESSIDQAKENMKVSTRQYAKRQISWIRNKLLPAFLAADKECGTSSHAFVLDASDERSWDTDVLNIATKITKDFMSNKRLPEASSLSDTAYQIFAGLEKSRTSHDTSTPRRQLICEICTVESSKPVMIFEGKDWKAHQSTKRHRHMATKRLKNTSLS